MSIRAIAFDLDGTLVDSIHDLAAAANAMRAALALAPLPAERVETYVGDGSASLVARTLLDAKAAEPDDSPLQRQARELFRDAYLSLLTHTTRPFDGVREALERLSTAGWPMAVVTNKPLAFTLPLLAELDLARYFPVVVGGDTLTEKKPHPAPLHHAAGLLGVTPAEMLMIGDSVNDVLSARAAGCPVWVVSFGYAGDPVALKADRVIADFGALSEALDTGATVAS